MTDRIGSATVTAMLKRFTIGPLLSLCLVLTSLAAVMAETRMAAAGGYCGAAAPQLLLDSAGLPILDADGEAVTAPDCPICHLSLALADTISQTAPTSTTLSASPLVMPAPSAPFSLRLDTHARAPPRPA